MAILINLLLGIHLLVCVLIVLVTLMQRPRSEGLGAAFGSGMTENIFGAQTTNVLAKFTTWLGGAFFAITLLLAIFYAKTTSGPTRIEKELLKMPAPAPAASPAASPEAAKPAATPSPTSANDGAGLSAPQAPVENGAGASPSRETEPEATPAASVSPGASTKSRNAE